MLGEGAGSVAWGERGGGRGGGGERSVSGATPPPPPAASVSESESVKESGIGQQAGHRGTDQWKVVRARRHDSECMTGRVPETGAKPLAPLRYQRRTTVTARARSRPARDVTDSSSRMAPTQLQRPAVIYYRLHSSRWPRGVHLSLPTRFDNAS